ncbi:unnamed protein product [Arabidopsis arenosa]|uniref:Uncharacterized protein n=1 Tax=Arabidopsis arenosa TaxID=38785 RepID=A0A8S2ANB2_ARAAE|nr:unnamed protein product [Arabidopsis arenosa]
MVTLEGKVRGLERIVEDMGRDLSTAGFGKSKSFANYPCTGKYNGRAPGDRDSQPDGAVRETMLNSDIPSHVASRNGQGGTRSPRSEQHENDGAVTRPTSIAAVPEDDKNKGQELVDVRTSYSKAIYSLQAGDINSAYAEVFGLGNMMLIIFLMQRAHMTHY